MSDPIDELLTESELAHDAALRELLGEIAREATAVRPIPSAELSALMSPPSAGARRVRRRSFAGRRAVITGVVVIGALGLGATAAAASPEARSAIGAGIAVIAHLFEPGDSGTGPHPAPVPGESDSRMPSPTPTARPAPSASLNATPAAHGNAGSSGHSNRPTSRPSSPTGAHGNGNGNGNQSGHGNGGGQGNGGLAPTP